MGRPSTFDQAIFDEVCLRMNTGESLRSICRSSERFPDEAKIRNWVTMDSPEGIASQYARAREMQMDAWADDIRDDSDNAIGVLVGDDKSDSARIQAIRLKVDTRKWLMSKIAPKRYSERVLNEHSGKDGGPITLSWQQ